MTDYFIKTEEPEVKKNYSDYESEQKGQREGIWDEE